MKDLIIRVALSAVVATVTSAGIMYFAFDQALRGVEAALASNTAALTETGQWVRSVDSKVDAVANHLNDQSRQIDKGFAELALDLSTDRDAVRTALWQNLSYTQSLRAALDSSIGTTAQIAEEWRASLSADDPVATARMELMLQEFQRQRQVLDELGSTIRAIENTRAKLTPASRP